MLKQKVSLVTGSTSGIGLGIARELARQGSNIVLNGFAEPAQAQELCKEIAGEFDVLAIHSPADLRKPAEIRAMVAEAEQRLGRIDILVNNAGIQHVAKLVEFPEDKWDDIIAVNLSAAFHATKAVLPGMIARQWGRIVNTASVHGLVGNVGKSAYIAAKHGIVGLTKATALEIAADNVTCNAICPGLVMTPLIANQIEAQAGLMNIPKEQVLSEVFLSQHPNHRAVETRELGGIVVFFCSEAAASITGTTLAVDGGYTAR